MSGPVPGAVAAAAAGSQALEPLPASPPIGGGFWTLLLPAVLLVGSVVGTLLLYRHFARACEESTGEVRPGEPGGPPPETSRAP